jgi:hypothetical protein
MGNQALGLNKDISSSLIRSLAADFEFEPSLINPSFSREQQSLFKSVIVVLFYDV